MELYETLPIVPLRDVVVFPHMSVTLPVDVGDEERVLLVPRHDHDVGTAGEGGRHRGIGILALGEAGNVLQRPGIGLDAAELQVIGGTDAIGDDAGVLDRGAAGALLGDAEIDQHGERPANLAGDGAQLVDPLLAVGDHHQAFGGAQQFAQAGELRGRRERRGDQQVGDARSAQPLRLADRGYAMADRAGGALAARDLGGFVGLGMGPERDAALGAEARHGGEVALECVEVEQECGRA